MKAVVEMRGITPLLMHNAQLADPDNEIVRAIAEINSKAKKTKEDRLERERLEFIGGLYMSDTGPAVPSLNIRKCWVDAGKASRLGTAIERGVLFPEISIPIEYGDGQRDVEGLWANPAHHCREIVNLNPGRKNGGRGPRMRPMFYPWALTVPVQLITSMIDVEQFKQVVEQAGLIEGLGDGRSAGKGRYEATVKFE